MTASIAERQRKRERAVYSRLVHALSILEYMRTTKHPDFDYSKAFKELKDIMK